MKMTRVTLSLLWISLAFGNALPETASALDPIDERAQRIVQAVGGDHVDWDGVGTHKLIHATAQGKFAVGKDEDARRIIDLATRGMPLVEYFDPEFPLWSTMDCYMRWKDSRYTPELKAQTKAYVAAATIPSNATTYNHHWMLAAGLILAYQEWGDEISYQFEKGDRTGKQWVLRQLNEIVRRGHGEELSPTYAQYALGPILTLHNFCEDEDLRHRARLTLDAMFIRRGCFYFRGHTAGMISRSYGQFLKANNGGGPNWLFFGGPENLYGASVIGFALSDYRPPAVAAQIAHDRGSTYQQHASMVRNGLTEWLTTYFDQKYAVGSACPYQNRLGRRSTWFQERLSWSIVWKDQPGRVSSFLLKHPTPKYGFDRNRYLGDSPFHQILQYEGTVIGLFDIPKNMPKYYEQRSWRRQILGGFPKRPQAMIDESEAGRVYLDYGSVLIAIAMTRGFEIQDDDNRHVHYFTVDADQDIFRVGYAVETARPSEFPGAPEQRLDAFRNAADARFEKMRLTAKIDHPTLEYVSVDGVQMELGWRPPGEDSVRLVDGVRVVPLRQDEWPLMQNPWVEQRLGGDIMQVCRQEDSMCFNFEDWEISDLKCQPESQ